MYRLVSLFIYLLFLFIFYPTSITLVFKIVTKVRSNSLTGAGAAGATGATGAGAVPRDSRRRLRPPRVAHHGRRSSPLVETRSYSIATSSTCRTVT